MIPGIVSHKVEEGGSFVIVFRLIEVVKITKQIELYIASQVNKCVLKKLEILWCLQRL